MEIHGNMAVWLWLVGQIDKKRGWVCEFSKSKHRARFLRVSSAFSLALNLYLMELSEKQKRYLQAKFCLDSFQMRSQFLSFMVFHL